MNRLHHIYLQSDITIGTRGIIEDSFKLTLDKFKNQAFKDFAARHQVNYLWQNLCKPVGVTARACAGRLQEISNYLEYFLGPDSNVPLIEGDLINILAVGAIVIPQLIK